MIFNEYYNFNFKLFICLGTDEERGIIIWREVPDDSDDESDDIDYNNLHLTMRTYNLPFAMDLIRKASWSKYVPFFPTFRGFDHINAPCACLQSSKTSDDVEVVISNSDKEDGEKKSEFSEF